MLAEKGRTSPDGLHLLRVALLLGDRDGEGRVGAALDGRGGRRPLGRAGRRPLPLQRVQLVDGLRAHRRRAVVVPHAVVLLLLPGRLDPRKPVRRRHLGRSRSCSCRERSSSERALATLLGWDQTRPDQTPPLIDALCSRTLSELKRHDRVEEDR
jgi:hypothetical protein